MGDEENKTLAESSSAEAVQAASVHAEAVEKARQTQLVDAMVRAREETAAAATNASFLLMMM